MTAGLYFYLSHADTDDAATYFVQKFFKDLCDAVRELAPPVQSDVDVGFADLRPGGEDAALIATAVAGARVFVPLYTPSYGDWPEHEREGVRHRLVAAAANRRERRIQPVIWRPVSGAHLPHLSDALQLAPDIPEYAELGLSTMCKLSRYKAPYREIVRRLAIRIVETLDPPPAAAAEAAAALATRTETSQRDFLIAVVAFTDNQLPPPRKAATCYGAWPMSWQPFRNSHNMPVAKYTADLAERAFGLPTRVVDFRAESRALEVSPGLILMDPWILANGDGGMLLSAALEMVVHPWVTLMVVLDSTDPQYPEGIALARQVASLMPHQNYKLTKTPVEFHREIRKVINRTRRRYLTSFPPSPDDSPGDTR